MEGKSHERRWRQAAGGLGGRQAAKQLAARKGAGKDEGSKECRLRGDKQAEGRAAGRDEGARRDDGSGTATKRSIT